MKYIQFHVSGSLPCASSKASFQLQNDPIIQKYGSKKVGLTQCMLTKEEMEVFHFLLQGRLAFNLMLVIM